MIARTSNAPPDATAEGARLGESERRLHRALLDGVLMTGSLPSPAELAARLKIASDAIPALVHTLAGGDYLALDDEGRITCMYPFSMVQTPHEVIIHGAWRYAMCAIDALGVAAMLGQAVQIRSSCAVCGAPIHLSVRPGSIDAMEPATTIVVTSRRLDEPAVMFTCQATVFACAQVHANQLLTQISEARVLQITDAHALGETLFAGHLAPSLPAKRCR